MVKIKLHESTEKVLEKYVERCNDLDFGFKLTPDDVVNLFMSVTSPQDLKKFYISWQKRVVKNMKASGDFIELSSKKEKSKKVK